MVAGEHRIHPGVVRLDRHGGQQLLRMHDRDDEGSGPHPRQRTVIRTPAAAEPMPLPVSGERGHEHHIGFGQRQHDVTAVDPELQVAVGEDFGQQHPRSPPTKGVQRRADIRLPAQRRVAGDHARCPDFGKGEQRRCGVPGVPGTVPARGKKPRPEGRFRLLVVHAN